MLKELFNSNDKLSRLIRTIIQGVIGVIIANLDMIMGLTPFPAETKPLIVAFVMAVLSPIMAYMGGDDIDTYDMECEEDDERFD